MVFGIDDVVQALSDVRGAIEYRHGEHLERVVGNREDSLDLFQAVSIKAYKGIDGFKGTTMAELRAWILGIARNTCRRAVWNNVHCMKRSRYVEGPVIGVSKNVTGDGKFEPFAAEGDPSVELEMREQCEIVIEALNQLPKRQAEAVRMRYLESRSYEEMAVVFDCSVPAVRNLVSRGLVLVRKILD